MRALFLLFALLAGSASADDKECDIVGWARAADDMLDASVFIWASVQRCQKPGPNSHGNAILCSVDVLSALESVNAMANIVLFSALKCGHFVGQECGLAAGHLTKATAGLGAGSAAIAAKCPNKLNGGHGLTYLVSYPGITQGSSALASAAQQASFAQCLVDVTGLTKTLFKASQRLMTIKECDQAVAEGHLPEKYLGSCRGWKGMKIAAAFSAVGEYLAGAIGRCSPNTAQGDKLREDAQCTSAVMTVVRHLDMVGESALSMAAMCQKDVRLYELQGAGLNNDEAGSSLTLPLAAFLPLAGVLGFVGGSRFAKSRAHTQNADLLEVESGVE